MKTCFKCGISKPLHDYYTHERMKDGYLNKCKACTKLDVRSSLVDYGLTEKGVIRVIYKTQVRNSRIRQHRLPDYSKADLAMWMYSNGYKNLFDTWVDSGYKKSKKPSVDRINSNLPYSFENITLVTWNENKLNQAKEYKTGEGSSGKKCKPVLKINPNLEVVHRYVSYNQAVRENGVHMEGSIRKGYADRKLNFFWCYEENLEEFLKSKLK